MRSGASVFVLFIAILMGVAAAFLARNWMASHSMHVAAVEAGKIVVAKAALPYGAQITRDDVAEISWPSQILPDGAFSSVQALLKDGTRVVLTPLVRNEPIVASKITAPNQSASLSTMIDAGKRAVTVAVDDVRGVAGFVYPGDHVDIVFTHGDFSQVILQDVKVLAIDQVAGQRQDKPTIARAVTVELDPQQSLRILLAASSGRLSLILRKPAEKAVARDTRVTYTQMLNNENTVASPPAKVAEAKAPAPPVEPTTSTVTVVRSLRFHDYVVPRGVE